MKSTLSVAHVVVTPSIARFAISALTLIAFAGSAIAQAPAQQAATSQDAKPRVTYARATAEGAKVRNLADASGLVVLDVPKDGLLAVYRENADWLEVEAPGGFEVWIYGEYVKPTAEIGVLSVTADNVRQRPTPSSGIEALPLNPPLQKGARLRFIERADPSKPLSQDWVKVYSQPGTRGWVAKTSVAPVAEGQDGSSLWAKAVIEASQRPAIAFPSDASASDAATAASTGSAVAANAAATPNAAKARELARKANEMLERERVKFANGVAADFETVQATYDQAATLAGDDAALKSSIAEGQKIVGAFVQAQALKDETQAQLATHEAQKAERERKLKDAQKVRDIYEGRFDARGWLERRVFAGQDRPTYIVHFGSDRVAELVCNSGRYELDRFVNFEIGVNGLELRPEQTSVNAIGEKPRVLDVHRIEVIGGRPLR